MTHAGWPGTVIDDMEAASAKAAHGPSIEVRFDSSGGGTQMTDDAEVKAWIKELKSL